MSAWLVALNSNQLLIVAGQSAYLLSPISNSNVSFHHSIIYIHIHIHPNRIIPIMQDYLFIGLSSGSNHSIVVIIYLVISSFLLSAHRNLIFSFSLFIYCVIKLHLPMSSPLCSWKGTLFAAAFAYGIILAS